MFFFYSNKQLPCYGCKLCGPNGFHMSHPPTLPPPQTTMCNIACKCVRKVTWTLLPHPTQQNPTFNLMTGTYSKSGTTTRSFPPASLNMISFTHLIQSYLVFFMGFSMFSHGNFPWLRADDAVSVIQRVSAALATAHWAAMGGPRGRLDRVLADGSQGDSHTYYIIIILLYSILMYIYIYIYLSIYHIYIHDYHDSM